MAIQSELNVPVKYIGVGETIEDLQKFNADEFVNALFDVKPDPSAEEMSDEAVATQASAIENLLELFHQVFLVVEAPCGITDQHIHISGLCRIDGIKYHRRRDRI